MFGKRKKKKTWFEVGLNGTAEELMLANFNALGNRDKRGNHYGHSEQRELQKGAVQAFKKGRPGNVQAILSHLEDFDLRYSHGYIVKVSHKVLSEITKEKEQDDAIAAIHTALANTSGQQKQKILNDSLLLCMDKDIWSDNTWKEDLVAPLLAAGADANQGGKVLAAAVKKDQPPFIIQQLHDNGASFDDALAYMMPSDDYNARDIKNMTFYNNAAKAEQALAQMKETAAELTGKQPPAADPQPQRASRELRTTPLSL